MANRALTHFVFVDLENVPGVDLAPLAAHSVQVTLLVGKKQSTLAPRLVEQITQLPFEVRLIKVGVSRKNALDFALVFHLGETVARFPRARFHIVSADKRDFDPLITHLAAHQVQAERVDTIAALAFLVPAAGASNPVKVAATTQAELGLENEASPLTKPPTRPRIKDPVSRPMEAPKPAVSPATAKVAVDRVLKIFARLSDPARPDRPSGQRALVAHIKTALGKACSDDTVSQVWQKLEAAGLTIDAKGKVVYP